jgi:putative transcriptional regulator
MRYEMCLFQLSSACERKRVLNSQTDIPQLILTLRGRTDLTQEKFVAKLDVTFPTINRWENGRAKPSPPAI